MSADRHTEHLIANDPDYKHSHTMDARLNFPEILYCWKYIENLWRNGVAVGRWTCVQRPIPLRWT